MNPRLRPILIGIGLLTLVIVAIILVPRGLSHYYQSRGGQHIDYVLRSVEGIEELVCEPLAEGNQAAIDEVKTSLSDLNRAVRFNRSNAHAYYYLGKAHCLLGEPKQAVETYLKYTELRPDNPLGFIGLGFAYEAVGEADKSKEFWIEAGLEAYEFNSVGDEKYMVEKYDQAIEWYERAIMLNSDQANSWLGLGESNEALDKSKETISAYLEGWKLDPERSTNLLIRAYQTRGNFIAVEEILEKMLDGFPNSSDRLYWYKELGDSYRGHGDYDQAIEVYLQAIKEFPNKPYLHLTLGWIYFDLNENNQLANREFEKAIELDGTIAESYYGLARIYSRAKLFQEADNYFQEAIIRSPENRWYYLERGNNARNAGDLEEAIAIYHETLEKYPDFAFGYYQLAQAYLMDGKLNDSIEAIELAISYNDSPVDQFYARAGNIYRIAGLIEKAINAYRLALSINPDNDIAIQGLASIDRN